jgi:beta-glucosidase
MDKDPYSVTHAIILAHASTYRMYDLKYRSTQTGKVGIVLNVMHYYPLDPSSPGDQAASATGYDYWYHWYLSPLTKGVYPQAMVERVGNRLPKFTPEQQKMITGAIDFIAINYYFPYVVSPGTTPDSDPSSFYKDMNITTGFAENNKFYGGTWPLSQTGWGIYAAGLRDVLLYTSKMYPQLPIYVTENGLAWKETVEEAIHDTPRQQYLSDHIDAVGQAIQAGANVKGYFIWSLQDNLEWNSGFEMQFGITFIKRPSLERVPKGSLYWYASLNEKFKAMKK